MAQIKGVLVETFANPIEYAPDQIKKACAVAYMLNRGKLVLAEPPKPSKDDEA